MDPVRKQVGVQGSYGLLLANASEPIRIGCKSDPACLVACLLSCLLACLLGGFLGFDEVTWVFEQRQNNTDILQLTKTLLPRSLNNGRTTQTHYN